MTSKFFITQNDKPFSCYPTLVIRKRIIGRIGVAVMRIELTLPDIGIPISELNKQATLIVRMCNLLNAREK